MNGLDDLNFSLATASPNHQSGITRHCKPTKASVFSARPSVGATFASFDHCALSPSRLSGPLFCRPRSVKLKINGIWTPDLAPALDGEGVPPDLADFAVFVQVSLQEVGQEGTEVFGFTVCSPSVLRQTEHGSFIAHTLVLDRFSWEGIRERVEKLLIHVESASSWEDVIWRLRGMLSPNDV